MLSFPRAVGMKEPEMLKKKKTLDISNWSCCWLNYVELILDIYLKGASSTQTNT